MCHSYFVSRLTADLGFPCSAVACIWRGGRGGVQVMSDEFEVEGRSVDDGDDPMWTSTTPSDDAQTSNGLGSQQFYNASYGTTNSGEISL